MAKSTINQLSDAKNAKQALPFSLPLFFVSRVVHKDQRFVLFTIGVCAIAATVACFQFAVFMSFLRAGSVVPRALGGDVWIVAHGVECFDFPTPYGEDYDGVVARYLPDAQFRRVIFGFSTWRSPIGNRSNVAIVGVERAGIGETSFVADRSDLARLDVTGNGFERASIGDTTLSLANVVRSLPTFLGAPYVMADFHTARRLLGQSNVLVSYLIADFPGGLPKDFDRQRAAASLRLPELDILTRDEFARSSSLYWQRKTGAGAAILLAALLAELLMIILLVNAIGRFVQRYDRDLLSLVGHGASGRDLFKILALVAGFITTATFAIALLFSPLVVALVHPMLPWVTFEITDMPIPALGALLGFAAVIVSARHALSAHGPAAVFRN